MNDEIKKSFLLRCCFCFATKFIISEKDPIVHGDMILCANCGKWNDYSSIHKVVKIKAEKWLKKYLSHKLICK